MGQEIPTSQFDRHDFSTFLGHLRAETELLRQYFREHRFVSEHNTGGFEVEAWLVDQNAIPAPINVKFLQKLNHPKVVHELAQFNIELNVDPQLLQSDALERFHQELETTWASCHEVAESLGGDVMAIGIHPGIVDEELTVEHMSTSQRYRALNEQVLAIRDGIPLTLDIHGKEDHLNTVHHDVMLEAATTSFQIHYQVRQEEAVRTYNASQIISAPLVALSANSPYLFGCDLWDETRIPLFEQSVDVGVERNKRVTLGHDFVKGSLFECFEDNLESYAVLIPINHENETDHFPHLRLHNGTIWRWNRPLIGFDQNNQPHLRIENRVVPAGPSMLDMIANAAFYWGVVHDTARLPEAPEQRIGFATIRNNFYESARYGLNSSIKWYDGKGYQARSLILDQLLPAAEAGLNRLGIDQKSKDRYLNLIERRVDTCRNGAAWQRAWVSKYGKNMKELSKAYREAQRSGLPVHEWDV